MDRLRQRNWRLGLRIEILPVNFPVSTELTRDGCDQHCVPCGQSASGECGWGKFDSGCVAHHALREATAQRSIIDDLKGFLINSSQFLSIKRSKAVNAFRT